MSCFGSIKQKPERKIIFVFIAVLAAYLLLLAFTPEKYFENDSFRSKGIRLFQDNYDRSVYFKIGSWLPQQKIPYKDMPSEYPQLATYFFALPFFLVSDQPAYVWTHALFMAILFVFMLFVLLKIWKHRNIKPETALLLLLPSTLYFALNRFDVLLMLLVLASLYCLLKGKYYWAFFLLSLSFMTKWFTLIFLPIYLNYIFFKTKQLPVKHFLVFALTAGIIFLHSVFYAGLPALVFSYSFYLERVGDSVLFLVFNYLFNPLGAGVWSGFLFLFLQGFLVLIAFFSRIDSEEKLLKWLALCTMFFIMFSKFYSPQWILWGVPLLLLLNYPLLKEKIVGWNAANYLLFPLAFDLFSRTPQAYIFYAVSLAVFLVQVWIVWPLLKELFIQKFKVVRGSLF